MQRHPSRVAFTKTPHKQDHNNNAASFDTCRVGTQTPNIMGNKPPSPICNEVPQDSACDPNIEPKLQKDTRTTNNAHVKTDDATEFEMLPPVDVLGLSRVVATVIEEGWLDAKDVGRYEMTNKVASVDPRLWKSLFRQKQGRHPRCIWCKRKNKDCMFDDHDSDDEEKFLNFLFWPISGASLVMALLITTSTLFVHPDLTHDIIRNMTKIEYTVWFCANALMLRHLFEVVLSAVIRKVYRKVEWSGFCV